jgi:peptide/nickel transport system substrate-binding protein
MLLALSFALLFSACAPAPVPRTTREDSEPARSAGPKRVTVAMQGEPHTLFHKLNVGGTIPGSDALEALVHANLATKDNRGELSAQLAGAVPTLENGLWRLLSDGRMEMTWKILPGARWHDGTPFTSEDLTFTIGVSREVPEFRSRSFSFLDGVDALDPLTLVTHWNAPYIEADTLFQAVMPIPRHLLESAYAERRDTFTDLPYWSSEFVGTGPFKLKELVRGGHILLEAYPDYALGRPRIDIVEVRFLAGATLAANLLANVVDVTIGRSISLEQSMEVRDRWRDGKMEVMPAASTKIFPQLLDPTPAIIGNVQLRRALYHAIDRQEMVDSMQGGLTPPAVSFFIPGKYPEADAAVRRYDYDPRRALQIFEELGYARGADGLLRGRDGAPLTVELGWTPGDDFFDKNTLSSADYWQRAGVAVELWQVPQALGRDRSIRALRKGFWLKGGASDVDLISALHSSEALLPETNYVGANDSRYMSPEYDALAERYQVTIPRAARLAVIVELARHVNEHLPVITLFYRVEPTMISNRMVNVTARWQGSTQAWNAHLWDVR